MYTLPVVSTVMLTGALSWPGPVPRIPHAPMNSNGGGGGTAAVAIGGCFPQPLPRTARKMPRCVRRLILQRGRPGFVDFFLMRWKNADVSCEVVQARSFA